MPSKAYRIVDEVLNAVTHGIGFGLSIAGLVLLLIKGAHEHSALAIVAYSLYGSSLILLFLFSTLAHSLSFTRAKTVFQIFEGNRSGADFPNQIISPVIAGIYRTRNQSYSVVIKISLYNIISVAGFVEVQYI